MKAVLAALAVVAVLVLKALPLVKGLVISGYRDGANGIMIFLGIVAALMALGFGWRAFKAWIATRSIRTV